MNLRLLIVSIFCITSTFAGNDSLSIKIYAPQLKKKEITLCSYYNGKIYKNDSTVISNTGIGAFHKTQKTEEGLYLVYVDGLRYFDLLIADQQSFQIEIDATDFINKNKISGAEQSEAFAEYIRFISGKQKERAQLFRQSKELKNENKDLTEINKKIQSLNQEVQFFQQSFYTKHQNQWVGKFFMGAELVKGPFPVPTTQEEAYAEFYFQKEHYFDNIDLKDPRFWRTNYFPKKIDSYMQNQVEAIPDSLANAASRLVEKTIGNDTCFRLMLSRLTNNSIESNIMGMENIWAKLAEDYYLKETVHWADSSFLSNIRSEYQKIKFNRIGMQAQNIPLQDTLNNRIDLYSIKNKYTLLCFFEPSCGHCKKIIPQLHTEIYDKYKEKGLEIACVCLLNDRKEWMDFVYEHQLLGEHWHNLWDPNGTSYYWQFFDTSVTPAIYLLDENRKIIAKKLDLENLNKILEINCVN